MKNGNGRPGHVIARVLPGSIAEEMGVEAGDRVIAVNGRPVEDIFDFRFLMADTEVTVTVADEKGEEYLLQIEKDEDESFGVEFENPLMDDYRSCSNRCIFCFIDQMPPGMRETLYFKDDDSRLSFLQGNYVTLTNMSDHDVERICAYRMEPINISIHATDPEIRCRMLHNRFAGKALEKIQTLKEAGITMNGQIVLCRGWNDKAVLDQTISDCTAWMPEMQSLSVVPVGLTRFRENLPPLTPFDKESASELIDLVENWQKKIYARCGTHFVYASDEFYILAGRPVPEEEAYDGYPQIENGVGMIRSFLEEAEDHLAALSLAEGDAAGKHDGNGTAAEAAPELRRITSVTGMLAAPYIQDVTCRIEQAYPSVSCRVVPIRNDFFGTMITVTGLVTGGDLISQMKEILSKEGEGALGDTLLLPCEMLRMGEDVFLDDVSVRDVEEALGLGVFVVQTGGRAYVNAVLGRSDNERKRRQIYEQADRSDRGKA